MQNKLLFMLFLTFVNCVILKETSGRLRGQTSETGRKIQQRFRPKESVQYNAPQWKNFNKFRKVMAGKLNIDEDLLLTPEVMSWFFREYILKGKEFDAENEFQTIAASVALEDILCSYCQTQRNCTCVKQHCFKSDGCP